MSALVRDLQARRLLPVVTPRRPRPACRDRGGAPTCGLAFKLNADRQSYSLEVNPVFGTAGKEVTLPKVPLLPGGEG